MSMKQKIEPIAVCGYSYRLPGGVETDDQFWDLLARRGYVQELIGARYGQREEPWDGFVQSPHRVASCYEGLITGGRDLEFDMQCFGMNPGDAKRMDPQIKQILSCTWEALQHAGMDQASLHNSNTGSFIGFQAASAATWRPPMGANEYDISGRSSSMIANRISYHFQWMGPSYGASTACSSGVTALDCAVKSLNVGECDMCAFGAVHYLGNMVQSAGFNKLGIISHTGTSRSFSKDANGYMRGEGCFVYILKRLADAERDGDKIFGIIRGVGLNCAGAELDSDVLSAGRMIVAPVGHAQQALMETVAKKAGIDPYDIEYLEAHATGTPVGDAIEGNAIANAYGGFDRPSKLRLASSRSNMGHMEAASFALSFLKVLMMMNKKAFLPISSHFTEPNPNIPWQEKQLRVQTEVEPFPERDDSVLISINSFGFGGANGHCVVEEYKGEQQDDWSSLPGGVPEGKYFMVPFSARSEQALVENAKRFVASLPELEKEMDLYTFAGNMSARWTHHRVRTCFYASTFAELKEKMETFIKISDEGKADDEIAKVTLKSATSDPDVPSEGTTLQPTVVMVFPGQGSQWAGCGKELYKTEKVFKDVVDLIDAEWMKLAGCKLSEVAFDPEAGDKLKEVVWAQPVTFMLQVGLLELLKTWGVHPNAVVGHSAGEAAATYATGAYTLEEATYLVYHRSRLQDKLSGTGRMLVLMMDKAATLEMLTKYNYTTAEDVTGDNVVDLACFNSPSQTVICGPGETIYKLQETLEADGQPKGKLIPGSIAFHSRWTTKIEKELKEILAPIGSKIAKVPFLSTVTANFVPNIGEEYWWLNVRKPVDMLGATNVIREQIQPDMIVELSPHITLRSPTRDNYSAAGAQMPPYVFTLVRNGDAAKGFAQTLGRVFKSVHLLDFKGAYPRPKSSTHLFPKYFFKTDMAMDPQVDERFMLRMENHHCGPLLGHHMMTPDLNFKNSVSTDHFTWMTDHKIQGQPLWPAAAYIELLMEAFEGKPIQIHKARFLHPCVLTDEKKYINTCIVAVPHHPTMFDFKITSRFHSGKDGESTLHCAGVVELLNEKMLPLTIPPTTARQLSDVTYDYSEALYPDSKTFYDHLNARLGDDFGYGPYFQGIKEVKRDIREQKLRVEIEIDRTNWEAWEKMGYIIHPSILDGALQIFLVYVMDVADFNGVPNMMLNFLLLKKPTSNKVVALYDPPEYMRDNMVQKGQVAFGLGERSSGHISLYDPETDELCAFIGDYTSFSTNKNKQELKRSKHFISWQPKDGLPTDVYTPVVEALKDDASTEEAAVVLIKTMFTKGNAKDEIPFFVNAAECFIGKVPEILALEECADEIVDKPVQYTMLAEEDKTDFLTDTYSKFNTSHKDAHLRFFHSTEDDEEGFLRPGMFEAFIARVSGPDKEPKEGEMPLDVNAELARLTKYVAPGGVMLVASTVGEVEVPAGYTSLWSGSRMDYDTEVTSMLLLAPPLAPDSGLGKTATDTEIVVDDALGFAEAWRNGKAAAGGEPDFDQAPKWTRVDYFAMQTDVDTDENIDLFDAPSKLTEFVKKFASRRSPEDVNSEPCVFTIYTSGAVMKTTAVAQGGIWGAVRSISMELTESTNTVFRMMDLKTKDDLKFVRATEPMREREMAIHEGKVFTSRMLNHREQMPLAEMKTADEVPFRLETDNSGVIADLEFKTMKFLELGPNEVEVAVKGTALNFRDIMVGLGRLPLLSYEASALGRTIGIECCGEIARVGSAVTRHKVGDRVAAMKGGCVANRIRCHELAAFELPSNLNWEQGASVVSVYVTAYYALCYLANINENSTILVHSAMGGVGQAALALAKLKGAKVYGTAGSEPRRKALREQGCVDAFDSHSYDWYPDLMEATGGKGVDIVLNSLAGYHVDLCLQALCPGGYHCEIGKVDIFADRPIRLAVFRKNLKYCAIDIDRLMMDNPMLSSKMTIECLDLLKEEKVPVLPTTIYKYRDYHAAITCMMNGQHRGKLVLLPPTPEETIKVNDDRDLFGVSVKDGSPRTVVLTGCMGGFGLRVVAYVLALGAKHIYVFDRDPERKRSAQWLKYMSFADFGLGEKILKDVKIHISYKEVSNYEHCKAGVAECKEIGFPPIGSVFHLAGVLDDKYVQDIDRDSFAKVYAPKAGGAWNLHRATLGTELDHFVMVSSTSSTFGNPGQTNYSAANSFQDALAEMRRGQGKHALSFCMGAVMETGMASRNPALIRMMKANGLPAISCIFAMSCLDSAIRQNKHTISVAAMENNLGADVHTNDFLRVQAQLVKNNAAFKLGKGGVLSKEAIMDMVSEMVAKICSVDEVDPTEPLSSYGLNSISVAELIAFLKQDMGYIVSAMALMTSATVESLAEGIISANTKSDKADDDEGDEAEEETKKKEVAKFDRTLHIREPSRFAPKIEEHFAPSSRIRNKTEFKTIKVRSVKKRADHSTGPAVVRSTNTLGKLNGKLPPACQETLDMLTSYMRSIDVTGIEEPTPVKDFKKVIITGATGFVGRHFIALLLDRTDTAIDTVYCPVRADSDEKAMERIVKAMSDCDQWDEKYRSRICAFAGNMNDEKFDASEAMYEDLLNADCIYHFAAYLNLAAGFDEMRQANSVTMKPVIKVCLTKKKKHLFHGSTLGMFPEYFLQFANDMADKKVGRDAMPDVKPMKLIFPLFISGYVWTKLINELLCYEMMRAKSIPLAVLRMPNMFANVKSGMMTPGDPIVCLYQSIMQTRLFPGRSRPFFIEDSHTCNMMMLNISLNPDRKNVIFNCSRQSGLMPTNLPSNFDLIGYAMKNVTYEEFKAKCLEMGEKSPLHSFWVLMDQYTDYWIRSKKATDSYAIDISTCEEDCIPLPKRPNGLDLFRKNIMWAQAHPDLWEYDLDVFRPKSDLETLIRPAKILCDKYGLELDKAVPTHAMNGLKKIVEEADLPLHTGSDFGFYVISRLETRVNLYHLLQMHPEIEKEQIVAPVFILGLNRTGSTFLHRMLVKTGMYGAPNIEDQSLFLPAEQMSKLDEKAEADRLSFIDDELSSIVESFEGIHDIGVGYPEEDMFAHGHSFQSLEFDIQFDLPKYREWMDEQSLEDVYAEHKKWLQYLTWSRRRAGKPVPRWCLKLPWHARSLEAIIKAYPDAVLLQTHRAVKDVAGSWFSLVENQRVRVLGSCDRVEMAKGQLPALGKTLEAAMTFRANHPELKERWLDIKFQGMIDDPVATAGQVITHSGMAITDKAKKGMEKYLKAQLAARGDKKLHSYNLKDYGVDGDVFESGVFAKYAKEHL